jgi:Mg-chelatase subunit ChlI
MASSKSVIKHENSVVVVATENGEYVKGDSFWPVVTDRIMDAVRHATMSDAKKYIKTASKRLNPKQKLHAVNCIAAYDDNFNLIEVRKE